MVHCRQLLRIVFKKKYPDVRAAEVADCRDELPVCHSGAAFIFHDSDICQAAKDLDVPLEFNLLGLARHARDARSGVLGYPCRDFWQIAAETGCKAIIGFDAHDPWALAWTDLYREAEAILEALGMTIVRALPFDK